MLITFISVFVISNYYTTITRLIFGSFNAIIIYNVKILFYFNHIASYAYIYNINEKEKYNKANLINSVRLFYSLLNNNYIIFFLLMYLI